MSVAYLRSFIYYRGISASFVYLDELVKATPTSTSTKPTKIVLQKKRKNSVPTPLSAFGVFATPLPGEVWPKAQWRCVTRLPVSHALKLL